MKKYVVSIIVMIAIMTLSIYGHAVTWSMFNTSLIEDNPLNDQFIYKAVYGTDYHYANNHDKQRINLVGSTTRFTFNSNLTYETFYGNITTREYTISSNTWSSWSSPSYTAKVSSYIDSVTNPTILWANFDVFDENGEVAYDSPEDNTYTPEMQRTHEVIEVPGAIEIHHSGFLQDDSLEITFTKYDFPNVDWGEAKTFTFTEPMYLSDSGTTVIFEFGEKYKPFFSMTDYYGVTVKAFKNDECTYLETTVGQYGTGTRYHALPYDTSQYIGKVPKPSNFTGTSMQIEGTHWTLLEWFIPNPSNWNIELQVKTADSDWTNMTGTPLTNGETDYLTNYTGLATHYRIRAQDNTDARRYSDWVVLDASQIDEEQNPNIDTDGDGIVDWKDTYIGSEKLTPAQAMTKVSEFIDTAWEALTFLSFLFTFLPEPFPSILAIIFPVAIGVFVIKLIL